MLLGLTMFFEMVTGLSAGEAARDPMGSDDSEADAAQNVVDRTR